MKLISDYQRIYRSYGQGVMPWVITFGVLITVAVIGYGIVIARVIIEGALPASPPDVTLPISWLASVLAVWVFMAIEGKVFDNYRTITMENRVNHEILQSLRSEGKNGA